VAESHGMESFILVPIYINHHPILLMQHMRSSSSHAGPRRW